MKNVYLDAVNKQYIYYIIGLIILKIWFSHQRDFPIVFIEHCSKKRWMEWIY